MNEMVRTPWLQEGCPRVEGVSRKCYKSTLHSRANPIAGVLFVRCGGGEDLL
jgi:hypothetical protein